MPRRTPLANIIKVAKEIHATRVTTPDGYIIDLDKNPNEDASDDDIIRRLEQHYNKRNSTNHGPQKKA